MENEEFRSLKELYERVYPALTSKKKELKKLGYSYIHEEDIWNALKSLVWSKKEKIELYDLVNDILNTDNRIIDNYVKEEFAKSHRSLIEDDENEAR